MSKPEVISIDGTEYVRKDSQKSLAPQHDGLEAVIVRTYSAGVFYGYLKSRSGKEVTLLNARRVFYWSGAATLSQLSIDGTSKPKDCKFPEAVSRVELTEAIEILPLTAKAKASLDEVKVWAV